MQHPYQMAYQHYQQTSQQLNLSPMSCGWIERCTTRITPAELPEWLAQHPELQGGWLAWEQAQPPLFATDNPDILKSALQQIKYPDRWPLEGELYGPDHSIQLGYHDGMLHLIQIRDIEPNDSAEAVLFDTHRQLGKKGRTPGRLCYRRYWQPVAEHGLRPVMARLTGFQTNASTQNRQRENHE